MRKKIINRDHKVEKLEKKELNGLIDMLSRIDTKINYSNFFGNPNVGGKITNLITLSNVPVRVVNERINFIFNMFLSNGYTVDDAKAFINNNPIIVERDIESIKFNYLMLNFIASKASINVIDLIDSNRNNDTILLNDSSNIYGIYSVICDMFITHGYDQNEAIEYIVNNKDILKLSIDKLLNKLVIFKESGKLETIFFEYPSILTENISEKELYEEETKTSLKNVSYIELKKHLDLLKNDFINNLHNNSEQLVLRK